MNDTTIDRSGSARLARRMERGAAFLGSEVAIMAGAMSWVSERNLVAAMSNAGGFGVIACGAMTVELLDKEIAATKALTDKPFGVNLITMHPDLMALIEVCGKHEVGHVVLAGGLPPKGSLEAIKASGAKVICFAPTLALAKKLIRSGVDALVIEGSEAGGHIGPVSTSVLAQEILPAIANDVPVFIAGGIGRGEAIAGYLDMGAAGVQLGTRFVCATESIAHPKFKQAFIRASARDAVASVQIDPRLPVIPVRALKNAGGELFTAKQREVAQALDEGAVAMAEAQLQIEHYWAGALRRAVIDGDVEHGSVMAGQSVGMVTKEEPLADIIASLMAEAPTPPSTAPVSATSVAFVVLASTSLRTSFTVPITSSGPVEPLGGSRGASLAYVRPAANTPTP
jgi:enoyl-[acyl-carrier protein] reductase II